MIDFSKKKRIVRSLQLASEKNIFMRVICAVALFFVKLHYAIICTIDITLSDKNGNFLGISRKEKQHSPTRKKQDEIIHFHRPFIARVFSLLMIFAFMFAFMPRIDISAFDNSINYKPIGSTNEYIISTADTNVSAITNLEHVSGYTAAKLTWTPVSDADGYILTCGKETVDISGGETSEYIFKVTPLELANYSVTAYKDFSKFTKTDNPLYDSVTAPDENEYIYTRNGDYRFFSSAVSTSFACAEELDPVNFELKYDDGYDSYNTGVKRLYVKLNNHVDGADGYIIYEKTKDDQNYSRPVEVVQNSGTMIIYTKSEADLTTVYDYKIIAYKNVMETSTDYNDNANSAYKYILSPDETATQVTDTAIPTKFKAVVSDDQKSIEIKWNAVRNATGYKLYRNETGIAPTDSDLIETLGSTETSYSDFDLVKGTQYYYFISALNKINSDWHESDTSTLSVTANAEVRYPSIISAIPDDGKITLTFESLDKYAEFFDVTATKITDKDGNALASPEEAKRWSLTSDRDLEVVLDNRKNGETYKFDIIAYKIVGTEKIYSDKVTSDPIIVGKEFRYVQDLSAFPSDGQIKLEWSKVEDATEYILYITDKFGNVSERSGTGTTYTHKNLLNGDTYSYYVKAKKVITGEEILSKASDIVTATVGVDFLSPQNVKATPDDGQITVEWEDVEDAWGYDLEIVGLGTTRIVKLTDTSYTHIGLNNGDKYAYTVKARKRVSAVDVYSDPSETVYAVAGIPIDPPLDFVVEYSNSANHLEWSDSDGAIGYEITATCGANKSIFYISDTSFVHKDVKVGETWTYSVRAYKTVNNENFYSLPTSAVSITVGQGEFLSSPTDLTLEVEEGTVTLTWTETEDAEGYTLFAYCDGETKMFNTSETEYVHTGLKDGEVWTYFVKPYVYINGQKSYGDPSSTVSATIGAKLDAPNDLVAQYGDREITLTWSEVEDAEGYVVYLFNEVTQSYDPITIVSLTTYTHKGLVNGQKYTYMVSAYKNVEGVALYGSYSFSVSAYASAGEMGDVDTAIAIKGTAPYGISHSELISAAANHDAFDQSVDAYFSTNQQSTDAIKEAMRYYADGLSSFIIYPFDISLYKSDTLASAKLNPHYNITFTMPIPDKLVSYRDFITVAHLPDDGTTLITERYDEVIFEDGIELNYDGSSVVMPSDLEILPSALIEINGHWCIQFTTSSCSPFALVIYKDLVVDVSSGASASASAAASNGFDTNVLTSSLSIDLLHQNRKLTLSLGAKKTYRLKNI